MGKHKSVFGEAVSEMKHFLLGAGLVLALVTVVPALAQMGPPPGGDMGGGTPMGGQMPPPPSGGGAPSGGQMPPPPSGGDMGGSQGGQMGTPPQGGQMGAPQGGQQMGGTQFGGPQQGGQMGAPQGGQQMGGQFGGQQGGQQGDPSKLGGFQGGKEGIPMPGFKPGEDAAGGFEDIPMPGFKPGEDATGGLEGIPMPGFKPTQGSRSRGSSKFGSSKQGGSQGSQFGGQQGNQQGGQGKSFGRGQGLGQGLETAPGQTGNFSQGGKEGMGMPESQTNDWGAFDAALEKKSAPKQDTPRTSTGRNRAQEKFTERASGVESVNENRFKTGNFGKAQPKRPSAPKLRKPKIDAGEFTSEFDDGILKVKKAKQAFNKKIKTALVKKKAKDVLKAVRSARMSFGATYEDEETGEQKFEYCQAVEATELPLEVEVDEFDCEAFVSEAVEALDDAIENGDYKTGVENVQKALDGFASNLQAQKEAVVEGVDAANAEEDGSEDDDLFDPVEEE